VHGLRCAATILHLGLDFLIQSLELVHVRRLGRPANTKAFRLIGLGDLEPGVSGSINKAVKYERTTWKWTYGESC
jgi:hypothetical protein